MGGGNVLGLGMSIGKPRSMTRGRRKRICRRNELPGPTDQARGFLSNRGQVSQAKTLWLSPPRSFSIFQLHFLEMSLTLDIYATIYVRFQNTLMFAQRSNRCTLKKNQSLCNTLLTEISTHIRNRQLLPILKATLKVEPRLRI
jgi:hypothetical protein